MDITDRKRAEDALKEADRARNEFLATLAHELRNPLAPIRNAVKILHLNGAPELQAALDVIGRQVHQMTRLIDDLLDLARITGNKLELRKNRVELAEVLHTAIEISHPLIEAGGQQLEVIVPPEPVLLDGDLPRLAQVISNLLNNAATYTARGGHIWLEAERQGRDVLITVRDTGVGIPAEMLPRVFDIFTQVNRPPDQPSSGLGIGLALAKRVAELHGGTITARSDGPGKGSAFIVRLPGVLDPSQAQSQTSHEQREATPAPSRRVLIVDDNADVVDSLSMLLQMTGYDVRSAPDGFEAVEVAGAFQPEVVLLDIGLPRRDGWDTARTIRQQPWSEGMVLIAVTGWGQEADRARSEAAGFDHHLVKPMDPDALLQLLASLQKTALDPGLRTA